jgi:hypothetical protein
MCGFIVGFAAFLGFDLERFFGLEINQRFVLLEVVIFKFLDN